MKMQLISLTLENFKCYEHMEFRFDGRNASIFGANGTGKSSVYDAFTWLLFGKDSKGSAKSEALKPIFTSGENEGKVKDSGAITSVEAVLLVDGVERKLKRTYYELWSTKRGSAEKTRDGHSSDYFVDDVPCKKNEFARRVKAGEALTPAELAERLFRENEEARRAMVRLGVLPEIAGRFSGIIGFQPLDQEARLAITVKQIRALGREYNLDIVQVAPDTAQALTPEGDAHSVRSSVCVLEGLLSPLLAAASNQTAYCLAGLPGNLRLLPAYSQSSSTTALAASSSL